MLSQPFFVPAFLMILISIPLIFHLIPRNGIYGIRTPKTLSNERIWYLANRFGGCVILISGGFYFLIAWLFPYPLSARDTFGIWLIHFCAFTGSLIISLLLTRRYINHL